MTLAGTDMDGPIALIGFGEAGQAFAAGWRAERPDCAIRAYDIKTDAGDAAVRDGKWADYARAGVTGCATAAEATDRAGTVFSLVTADQALSAARNAASSALSGALFFDGNSCAPGTKRKSADAIARAGGRYVDCAIMAPVHPRLHKTALLLAGDHADAALGFAAAMGMNAEDVAGPVGAASSVKMIRSVMMKGLEALVLECVLAGRAAGVDERVLASLEATYPGFDWAGRSAYMLERAMTHGIRRAAEMEEVAQTIADLGLPPDMARATVAWEARAGALGLNSADYADDYAARADALLDALSISSRIQEETGT